MTNVTTDIQARRLLLSALWESDLTRGLIELAALWGDADARAALGKNAPDQARWSDREEVLEQATVLWESPQFVQPLLYLSAGLIATGLPQYEAKRPGNTRLRTLLEEVFAVCESGSQHDTKGMIRRHGDVCQDAVEHDERAGLQPYDPASASWLPLRSLEVVWLACDLTRSSSTLPRMLSEALKVAEHSVGLESAQAYAAQLLLEFERFGLRAVRDLQRSMASQLNAERRMERAKQAVASLKEHVELQTKDFEHVLGLLGSIRSAVIRGDLDSSEIGTAKGSLVSALESLNAVSWRESPFLSEALRLRAIEECEDTLATLESFCVFDTDWKGGEFSLGDLDAWKGGADQSYDLGHGYDDGFGGGPLV